ncbi:MAG: CBS domain-containing protein [Bacteroidales bacterium]|jgi:CBS domain-containing protein
MLAKDLLTDLIPAVTRTTRVDQVLAEMREYRVTHLPFVEQDKYQGLLSEKDTIKLNHEDQLANPESLNLLTVSTDENQHIYEVIDLVARYELTLLPVISADKAYLGSITLPALVKKFSDLSTAGQPGAVIVLGLAVQDYSPALLSRIVEDNNAKIISLYVVADPNGRELAVTLKVNTGEPGAMMRAFDRYGYSVHSFFMTNSQVDDFYRSRYEEFMNYMNI